MGTTRAPILFVDAYDSFSNNVISLLEGELPVSVTKIRIDEEIHDLPNFLRRFCAVVVGPGPGNPVNPEDVGLIGDIWNLEDDDLLPILGICLGFQSLVYAFGGRIERLPQPRHGIETKILTCGSSIFEGFPEIASVQYHSLHATLGDDLTHECSIQRSNSQLWKRSSKCPVLRPLAWDIGSQTHNKSITAPSGRILMAVQHTLKPFFGVQFHPESICSSPSARCVIRKWWNLGLEWLHCNRPQALPTIAHSQPWLIKTEIVPRMSDGCHSSSSISTPSTVPSASPSLPLSSPSSCSSLSITEETSSLPVYQHETIRKADLDIPGIVELLDLRQSEIVILDSEKRQIPNLSTYSIIGLIDLNTVKLTYALGDEKIKISKSTDALEEVRLDGNVLTYLKTYMKQRKLQGGPADLPFWGGLMGYITYEACLESIGVPTRHSSGRPDLGFVYVERSIVIDHANGTVHVQSIRPNDLDWIRKTQESLMVDHTVSPCKPASQMKFEPRLPRRLPSETRYKPKISKCQEEIRAGNSYELCLTNQATISTKPSPECCSWERYLKLRTLNPAPFAAYIRLAPLTVLSTSPERFLSWTRPKPESDRTSNFAGDGLLTSTCQFRPIKGTVKKRQTTATGERLVGLEEATALLSTPKERAENLMIVDLIRHDLSGVVGSGNARVTSLMSVEEYESVYQLVSVIEGNLIAPSIGLDSCDIRPTPSGIDVLAASLPPGSMTGAPKKRSCEILRSIEDEPRSVYSGVLGYMCVGGGGDFSVVIRTVYKWDENGRDSPDEWKIGAGGAITALSNEDDEWEEMLTKLRSTLGLFDI